MSCRSHPLLTEGTVKAKACPKGKPGICAGAKMTGHFFLVPLPKRKTIWILANEAGPPSKVEANSFVLCGTLMTPCVKNLRVLILVASLNRCLSPPSGIPIRPPRCLFPLEQHGK